MFHGQGAYTWTSGSLYKGGFVHGRSEGYGTFLFANGARYDGEFSNDKFKCELAATDASGV